MGSTHGDFKTIEASRPDWDSSAQVRYTKTPNPDWKFGGGQNQLASSSSSSSSTGKTTSEGVQEEHKHVAIDPYEEGRPGGFNYKLLISAIVPRPICFMSTRSADGKVTNLAPFSYFNMVNHDPPLFVVGITATVENPKDSLRNVLDSKECVINIISEQFVEAANATCIDAPYGASEWAVSGLTADYSCQTVKAPRVKEAVFSVEAKLESFREWESTATPGKKTGVMLVLEGTRFWAREDAINEEKNLVDLSKLRPIARLGGITYSRTTELIELPRPSFARDLGGQEAYDKLSNSEKL